MRQFARAMVLIDHAAEYLPALHRRVKRHERACHDRVAAAAGTGAADDGGSARRRPAARCGDGSRHRSASGPRTEPVRSLPAFRVTVRPRRLRRSLHHPYALAGEDIIEHAGELGVAVLDEEPEGADPAGEVPDHAPGGTPRPSSPPPAAAPVTELPADRRATRPARVSPLTGKETTVPGQQRSGRDQPAVPKRGWQQPGQCRQDPGRPGPAWAGPPDGGAPSPRDGAP
jgi:hypothetical protein